MTPDELQADARIQKAEKRLKASGFSDAWWLGLLERVAHLPTLYEMVSQETVSNQRERRAKLAKKMLSLGKALDSDPDTNNWVPAFRRGNIQKPYIEATAKSGDDILTLGGWLSECAESLDELSDKKRMLPSLETLRGNSLKSFVIRGVFHWIEQYLASGRVLGVVTSLRPKNEETALIASAILKVNITANDVTQVRKNERSNNFIE